MFQKNVMLGHIIIVIIIWLRDNFEKYHQGQVKIFLFNPIFFITFSFLLLMSYSLQTLLLVSSDILDFFSKIAEDARHNPRRNPRCNLRWNLRCNELNWINPFLFCPILFCPVLPVPILLYPLLFPPILPYYDLSHHVIEIGMPALACFYILYILKDTFIHFVIYRYDWI